MINSRRMALVEQTMSFTVRDAEPASIPWDRCGSRTLIQLTALEPSVAAGSRAGPGPPAGRQPAPPRAAPLRPDALGPARRRETPGPAVGRPGLRGRLRSAIARIIRVRREDINRPYQPYPCRCRARITPTAATSTARSVHPRPAPHP